MASKLQRVSELSNHMAHEVTRSVENWTHYLDTASRVYKYPFDEQLLIYAQKPDATACASMELWNEKMRRWVKPGTTGIALIRKNGGGRPHLEYVFDVSDTRPVQGAKVPNIWELREEHHDTVIASLEGLYGTTEATGTVEQFMELAERAVSEVYRDRLNDLSYDTKDSLLEELDDLNIEVRFRRVLTASVQYTLLKRCGYDANGYVDVDALSGIMEFSTPTVLHHLGEAVSTVSMDLLNEIGRSVRRYEREAAQNREKNSQKPLANTQVIGYTEDAKKFNTLKRESDERSEGHERTDVHEGGRLPDSRSGDGRRGVGGGDAAGQVRDVARDVPARAAQGNVHVDAADGTVGEASAGDRPAGAGAGRPDRERLEEAEQRGRGAESQKSDGMGAGGEQLHGAGRGNGTAGDRLQVTTEQSNTEATGNKPAASPSSEAAQQAETPVMPPFALFPTVEEQIETIAEVQAEENGIAETQTEQIRMDGADRVGKGVISRALTAGSNERGSIYRIVAHFQKDLPIDESAEFLRKEFRTGGKGVTIAGQK